MHACFVMVFTAAVSLLTWGASDCGVATRAGSATAVAPPSSATPAPRGDCPCVILEGPYPNPPGAGGGSWAVGHLNGPSDGDCAWVDDDCPDPTTPCKISVMLRWTPPANNNCNNMFAYWGIEDPDADAGGGALGTSILLKHDVSCGQVVNFEIQCLDDPQNVTTVAAFRMWCTDCGFW